MKFSLLDNPVFATSVLCRSKQTMTHWPNPASACFCKVLLEQRSSFVYVSSMAAFAQQRTWLIKSYCL